MPIRKIITPGERFARWTALDRTESRTYPSGATIHFRWCRCDCGKEQWVSEYKLRTGHSRSCGCLQAEVTTERSLTHGRSRRGAIARVYRIWRNMLTRCTNPNGKDYASYGGRGITVCKRWESFENFLEDMGEPPSHLTLDRLDNNAGYSKENCAWRTPVDQARNRRNTIKLTFGGLTLSLKEWAERLNVDYTVLRARFYAKWTVEEILAVPVGVKRPSR